jgi:hypothetical protein
MSNPRKMGKLWYIYEYYVPVKMKELQLYISKRTHFQNIMVNKSKLQKDTYSMVAFM